MAKAGRPKGSPNKDKQDAIDLAKKLGVDPLQVLLLFAKNDWKKLGYKSETITKYTPKGDAYEVMTIEPDTRMGAAKEASQYIYAKRKAIEHSGPDGGPIAQEVEMVFDTQWREKPDAPKSDT